MQFAMRGDWEGYMWCPKFRAAGLCKVAGTPAVGGFWPSISTKLGHRRVPALSYLAISYLLLREYDCW